jgi:Zn-dependent protease
MDHSWMINVLLTLMLIASFLIAVALHEWSHALVATWLGDDTPKKAGRLTVNLRSHLDPVGLTLAIFLAFRIVIAGPVALGWGKPVSVDPWKLRTNQKTGMLLVSIAGMVFNLLLGLLLAMIARFASPFMTSNIVTIFILQFLIVFAVTNVALAIFNLIPCYPLDGYQILHTLLPSRQAGGLARTASYGPLIILALFFLLPFLGELSGTSNFFLFHLALYILGWAQSIVAMAMGVNPDAITSFWYL